MGPVKLRWLVVFVLVLLCGVLIWWGRRADTPAPNPSPGVVEPSVEVVPPPKPVSWHVVVDSLELTPAPGLAARMPAKLLLEGTPTEAPCHYRMNLYAGMNKMTAKEGELKPGESLEVPPGTERVSVQLDGVGKEGKPLRFRGLWRQAPRPHLEVLNGVAFILGEDGILRRVDVAKNPQGDPEVIPGIEQFRISSFGTMMLNNRLGVRVDALWAIREDDSVVVLRKDYQKPAVPGQLEQAMFDDPLAEMDRKERSQDLRLFEPGVEAPAPERWEAGPFKIYRLPTCKDDVLAPGGGPARIVELAARNSPSQRNHFIGDGKMTVLLSDGQLFSLETKDGRQFQPFSLEGKPFVVQLGGEWFMDGSSSGSGGGSGEAVDFHQESNRLAAVIDADGKTLGLPPDNRKSLAATNQEFSSPGGIVLANEVAETCFDRQGRWLWRGQPVPTDPALSGIVIRKLVQLRREIPYSRPKEIRLLCLDAAGIVRLLKVSEAGVVLNREWRETVYADIAVAIVGNEMAAVKQRQELPLPWALTRQGKPVCLDPSLFGVNDPSVQPLVKVPNSVSPAPSGAARENPKPELSADLPGGMYDALPAQVKIVAWNAAAPVSYRLTAFRGLVRQEPKQGTLASGEALDLPAGATAVALELSQGTLKQRILWTLAPRDDYPRLLHASSESRIWNQPREYWHRDLQVALSPDEVWSISKPALAKLVEEGLRLPGAEVSVPAAGKGVWILDPKAAQYRSENQMERKGRLQAVEKILPHRKILRQSPNGCFFQAMDGAFYIYEKNQEAGDAIALISGWGREHQPALWDGKQVVDGAGELCEIYCSLSSSPPFGISLVSNPVYLFEKPFLVGQTLSGHFLDVDGNLWAPNGLCLLDKKSAAMPSRVADIAWIPYEPNPEFSRGQNLVLLMEDGSLVALYPTRGQAKRIRLEGISWKQPK